MSFDARKNFAYTIVAVAPSPADTGNSLGVNSGDGALFAASPFNAVAWPANVNPTAANAEIVRVTAISTDTFTITRHQEGSTAQSIGVGWQFMAGLTDRTLADIESAISTEITNRISAVALKEDAANKSNNTSLGSSTSLYPTQNAVKTYTDGKSQQSLVRNEVPGGTINGSNTAFTTASSFATGSLRVYKNGIRLKGGGADYTEGASSFTMVTAPATSTVLLIDYEVSDSQFSVGTNSIISDETPSGLVNSSNTSFTAARAYIAGTLEVFINGLKQARTTHITESNPGTGAFTTDVAPTTGDIVRINYQYNLNPSGNSDTVDGIHANATPTANQLLPLDSNAMVPTAALGGAWTPWTPTVTANSGSFTAASGSGKWTQIGKTVHFKATITITTVGTGNGVQFTLPATAQTSGDVLGGYRETVSGGLTGTVTAASTTLCILHEYDNSQTLANGNTFRCYGTYEVA